MNERDTTQLNDYFNSLLSPAEAQQVQERAAADPEFGREFSLREEMEDFPRRAAQRKVFTGTLTAIEKDFFTENNAEEKRITPQMTAKINWGRWAAAIAASLVIVFGAWWFFNQSSVPEYRQYAGRHAKLSLTTRGVADQDKSAAEKAFNAQDYAAALPVLERILAADSTNITVQRAMGICLLETDRPAEARARLEPIAKGQSALRSEANWYIALSYLKEKNYAACKTALKKIESGDDNYIDAQDLLKKLK